MLNNSPHKLALIAENASIVLTFAHSRASFLAFHGRFAGEWKGLGKILFEVPELRADRALLELAYLLRNLDTTEGISANINFPLGSLHMKDGSTIDLSLREMTNKVIHAARLDWMFENPDELAVKCIGEDIERWECALIQIDRLAATCGIMSL